MKRTIGVVVFLLILAAGAAAQRIQIQRPTMYPADRAAQEYLDDQILRGIALAEAAAPGLEIGYSGFGATKRIAGAQYRVDVTATPSDEQPILVFNTSGGSQPISYPYLGEWGEFLHVDLGAIFGYVAAMLEGTPTPDGRRPVQLFDFNTRAISTADLPYPSPVYPQHVASYGEDSILVAANTYVVTTDLYFRERAKVGADQPASLAWASLVGGTPGGSIVAASMALGGITRYVPDVERPYRIPTSQGTFNLLVMSDGSIVLKNTQSQIFRVEGTSVQPLQLQGVQTPYITYMERGPGDTIWVWDPVLRGVVIFSLDGRRLGLLLPQIDQSEAAQVRFMTPYPDGGLLLMTFNALSRFDRSGAPIWSVPLAELPRLGGVTSYLNMSFDPRIGAIHLVNTVGLTITRLLDVEYRTENGGLSDVERELTEIGHALDQAPNDIDLYIRQARLFDSIEAYELAQSAWETALGLDPTDARATAGYQAAEVRNLRISARRSYERTLRIFETLGPASARTPYQMALQIYEQLFALDPNDAESRADRDNLVEYFTEPEMRPQPGPLSIVSVEIPELFPALLGSYRRSFPARVTVDNGGQAAASDLRIEVSSRELDFPATSSGPASITPGQSVSIGLPVPISEKRGNMVEIISTTLSLSPLA